MTSRLSPAASVCLGCTDAGSAGPCRCSLLVSIASAITGFLTARFRRVSSASVDEPAGGVEASATTRPAGAPGCARSGVWMPRVFVR